MKKLTLYYIVIAALLLGKTATTLYQRSVIIHHGHSVANLQNEKKHILEQQLNMTTELAEKNSLAAVEKSFDTNTFQPISTPLVITNVQLATSQL